MIAPGYAGEFKKPFRIFTNKNDKTYLFIRMDLKLIYAKIFDLNQFGNLENVYYFWQNKLDP